MLKQAQHIASRSANKIKPFFIFWQVVIVQSFPTSFAMINFEKTSF